MISMSDDITSKLLFTLIEVYFIYNIILVSSVQCTDLIFL